MDKRNVILFGSGRSGTTWVSQIISASGLELIFEPFHHSNVPEARHFGQYPTYLTRNENTHFKNLLINGFQGKIRNSWTLRQNVGEERKVIKTIRSNLIIDWVKANIDAFTILIIRNPYATILSQIKQNWYNDQEPDLVEALTKNSKLNRDFLKELVSIFPNKYSLIDLISFQWCVQNYVPLNQKILKEDEIIRYETIIDDPLNEIEKLLTQLGCTFSEEVETQIQEASFMSGKDFGKKGYDPKTAWQKELSDQQKNKIAYYLKEFKLETYAE